MESGPATRVGKCLQRSHSLSRLAQTSPRRVGAANAPSVVAGQRSGTRDSNGGDLTPHIRRAQAVSAIRAGSRPVSRTHRPLFKSLGNFRLPHASESFPAIRAGRATAERSAARGGRPVTTCNRLPLAIPTSERPRAQDLISLQRVGSGSDARGGSATGPWPDCCARRAR